MLHLIVAIYIILIIAMIASIWIIRRANVKNSRSMVWLIGTGILTAASYTISIMVPNSHPQLAVLMNGVYFAGTDWLAIALMFFIADYTGIHMRSNTPRLVLTVVALFDSVSLIANTYTRHIFTMVRAALTWGEYWQIQYMPLLVIHLSFVYLIVAYCVALLLYRLVKTPKIYKMKYGSMLLLLASVVILNLACVLVEAVFDYSVLIYGFLAMSICYFVLYASPRRLLEDMHSTLAEDSVIGMFVYDDSKQCVSANRAARELFSQEEDIYGYAEQYLTKWENDNQGHMKNVMGAERTVVRDGETMYFYVNYQKLLDEKERLLGFCFQFEDRTDVVKQYQEEKYRATHDMMTGLLNRGAFEERVKEILSETDEPYCMVCTNIKDFKLINELCGSEVGDALLLAQADMIRGEEGGNSVSVHMYADRFCTLMPKRHYNEDRFMQNMTELLDRAVSMPLKTHFYVGVYDIVDTTELVWTMCDKAMMAIDSIRGNYGQYFSYYREELFQRIIREKQILGSFDKAIEDEEFHMFLQPQIANDGTVVGAEALVRWIRPDQGMISPADFIPVLEKAGLIHKLDLYMWEKAAQKLEEWKRAGKNNLSISVNISTEDFYLIDIYEAFRAISDKYDFDIKNLKLEITESALMRDVRKIMQNMTELHGLGYDIEIDDFGSGYSSLGMLKDIHADILKIDMIFLQETKNTIRSETIIKNVISMSKELGMPVITEGVETKEQLDFLQSVGCDMFQGYYFARPMSTENFEREFSA